MFHSFVWLFLGVSGCFKVSLECFEGQIFREISGCLWVSGNFGWSLGV